MIKVEVSGFRAFRKQVFRLSTVGGLFMSPRFVSVRRFRV